MDAFSDDVFRHLECPVCLRYMTPPIMQCINGHCICPNCRKKLETCSLCRCSYTNVRCRALEDIANRCTFPCLFAPYGCDTRSRYQELENHEQICEYRHYSCLIRSPTCCSWQGKRSDIEAHVRHAHHGHVFYPGQGVFKKSWSGHYVKLAIIDDNLFWYHLIQEPSTSNFLRAFQFIGPPNTIKFTYSFEFNLPGDTTVSVKKLVFNKSDDVEAEFNDGGSIFSDIANFAIQRCGDVETIPCTIAVYES